MRQIINSPLGKLSFVGNIHIDTDMKGKHFDMVAMADNNAFEATAIAILADLMDEDPYKLTMSELYYYFLMVKVSSLGPKLKTTLTCPNMVSRETDDGKKTVVCGYKQDYEFSLIDSDVKYVPAGYSFPRIKIVIKGEEREFQVVPPKMKDELSLLTFYGEQGVSRVDLIDYKDHTAVAMDYARSRLILHLCPLDDKQTDYIDDEKRGLISKALLDDNSVRVLQELAIKVQEVNSFGVENKTHVVICKECGGKISFRLPLRAGLSI